MDIDSLNQKLSEISLQENKDNELVIIKNISDDFRIIGIGTDAVVVQPQDEADRVYKVYAKPNVDKKETEYHVYELLQNSPYFAKCFYTGENYLCLSYEQGPTLYECLEKGIKIPEQVIWDVKQAQKDAYQVGLNPRDIHLKNVLLQNGRAKLIDVSEYVLPGDDKRWEHLVQGYRDYYPLIEGKKIPSWLIESVKKAYYIQVDEEFSVSEFIKRMNQKMPWN